MDRVERACKHRTTCWYGNQIEFLNTTGGTPTDSEDTLRFAEMTGVRPMIEKLPLEKAPEAYARMIEGRARFRMVLVAG